MLETIGRYRLVARLDRGRLGAVYQALDVEQQRQVALRLIDLPAPHDAAQHEHIAALRDAARAAAILDHPGIAAVVDHGEAEEAPAAAGSTGGPQRVLYIASAWVGGESLARRLRAGTVIEPDCACRWMTQILFALDHAHSRKLVHADLKPANVLFKANDEVSVTDFGLTLGDAAHPGLGGSMLESPAHLAPEQLLGDPVDARSDLFAAGVMLYEMLAGGPPFQGQAAEVMKKILAFDPPRLSQVQGHLGTAFDVVVSRALARDPKRRFESAILFLRALNRAIAQRAQVADATVILPAAAARPSRAPAPPTMVDWKNAAAAPLETALAGAVGPIARVLVRHALAHAANLDDACTELAAKIPTPAARGDFIAAAAKIQTAQVAAEDSAAGTGRAPLHSTSTLRAQTPGPVIDQATLDLATERLGDDVGPMARILVDRTAAVADSRSDFFRRLAQWISTPRQKRAFLREFGFEE